MTLAPAQRTQINQGRVHQAVAFLEDYFGPHAQHLNGNGAIVGISIFKRKLKTVGKSRARPYRFVAIKDMPADQDDSLARERLTAAVANIFLRYDNPGYHIYFEPQLMREECAPVVKIPKYDQIFKYIALFIDVDDYKTEAGVTIKEEWLTPGERKTLGRHTPRWVIRSGGGRHLHFRLGDAPDGIKSAKPQPTELRATIRGMVQALDQAEPERSIDKNTSNVVQISRLPGSRNWNYTGVPVCKATVKYPDQPPIWYRVLYNIYGKAESLIVKPPPRPDEPVRPRAPSSGPQRDVFDALHQFIGQLSDRNLPAILKQYPLTPRQLTVWNSRVFKNRNAWPALGYADGLPYRGGEEANRDNSQSGFDLGLARAIIESGLLDNIFRDWTNHQQIRAGLRYAAALVQRHRHIRGAGYKAKTKGYYMETVSFAAFQSRPQFRNYLLDQFFKASNRPQFTADEILQFYHIRRTVPRQILADNGYKYHKRGKVFRKDQPVHTTALQGLPERIEVLIATRDFLDTCFVEAHGQKDKTLQLSGEEIQSRLVKMFPDHWRLVQQELQERCQSTARAEAGITKRRTATGYLYTFTPPKPAAKRDLIPPSAGQIALTDLPAEDHTPGPEHH